MPLLWESQAEVDSRDYGFVGSGVLEVAGCSDEPLQIYDGDELLGVLQAAGPRDAHDVDCNLEAEDGPATRLQLTLDEGRHDLRVEPVDRRGQSSTESRAAALTASQAVQVKLVGTARPIGPEDEPSRGSFGLLILGALIGCLGLAVVLT